MLKETQKALNAFGKYVIQQSRTNLTKKRINASKTLYNALDYEVKAMPNSFYMKFDLGDYGAFIDEGVKGAKSTYPESIRSRFKYTGRYKSIPPNKLDKWMVRRNIQGVRNEKGQFIPRKTLRFILARSIYQKGIKASLFFTTPFERAFKNLPDELIKSFGLDVENLLQYATKK